MHDDNKCVLRIVRMVDVDCCHMLQQTINCTDTARFIEQRQHTCCRHSVGQGRCFSIHSVKYAQVLSSY